MAKGGRGFLGKFRSRRDGSVAAEFAMIFPLFFSLVMGGIEYGSIAFSMNAMQQAANVAAREIAVNRLSEAGAKALMTPYLPGWVSNDVSMVMIESHPEQPRINTVTVRLQASAENAAVLPIFSRALPWTVTAEANVQQEMPFDNAVNVDDDVDDDDDDGDDDD